MHSSQAYSVCPDTWVFMHRRYGLSQSTVLEVEAVIHTLPLVCQWWHPALTAILDVDVGIDMASMLSPGSLIKTLDVVGTVVLTPILEECTKHYVGWPAMIGIAALELVDAIDEEGVLGGIRRRVISTGVHVACQLMPLPLAIVAHAAYNLFVTWLHSPPRD